MTGTKGNVVVELIKVGDIHYETAHGHWAKVIVKTLPVKNKEGAWVWTSQIFNSDRIVNYSVHPEYTQYAPELYDYPAWMSREEYNEQI